MLLLLACAQDYELHAAPTSQADPPRRECLDFEEGGLESVGLQGELAYMEDGAIVRLVGEGTDFSALLGEEDLDLPGERSLLLRSSHMGIVGTTARVELAVPPGARALELLQLSEVEEGVELVLSTEQGWVELPALTGGFVPALKPEHGPILDHPEIVDAVPLPGRFTPVRVPVAGEHVELTQTTLSEGNGFFTLLDELCWLF